MRVLYFTGETLLAPRELLTGTRHEGVFVPAYFTGCRSPAVEWRRLVRGIWGVGVGVKDSPTLASPDDACTPFSQVQTPYGVALCEIHESHGCSKPSKPLPGELIWGASAGVPASLLRE